MSFLCHLLHFIEVLLGLPLSSIYLFILSPLSPIGFVEFLTIISPICLSPFSPCSISSFKVFGFVSLVYYFVSHTFSFYFLPLGFGFCVMIISDSLILSVIIHSHSFIPSVSPRMFGFWFAVPVFLFSPSVFCLSGFWLHRSRVSFCPMFVDFLCCDLLFHVPMVLVMIMCYSPICLCLVHSVCVLICLIDFISSFRKLLLVCPCVLGLSTFIIHM